MPVVKKFYSTQDITKILSCSRSYALQLMHMFELQGKVLREGRLLRVPAREFDKWAEARMVPKA